MRTLLFLAAILLTFNAETFAASDILKNIENIDLNLKNHEMAVTFLQLSDGEATLIQGPDQENVLVNAGTEKSQKELKRWLSLFKVKGISKLIMTSGESLPLNLIKDLIDEFQVKEIIVPSKTSPQISRDLDFDNGIVLKQMDAGTTMSVFPELTITAEYVGSGVREGLDFTMKFFKHKLLMMTSVSQRAEQSLINKNFGAISVFKVPICEKNGLVSDQLIKHVNPQISILNSAANHKVDYDLIDDLYKNWSEVYLTKKQGTVTIKFTEANYEIFTIPDGVDN